MDPITAVAGAAGAAGSIGGPLLSFFTQKAAQKRQFDFQREMWKKTADYQTQMSNTAFQRSMADMRSAGLNPILASKLGGASTPSMSVPPGGGMGSTDFSGIGEGLSSALKMSDQRSLTQNALQQGKADLTIKEKTGGKLDADAEEAKSRAVANYQAASEAAAREDTHRADTALRLGQATNLPAARRELEELAKLHVANAKGVGYVNEVKELIAKGVGSINTILDRMYPDAPGGRPGGGIPDKLRGALENLKTDLSIGTTKGEMTREQWIKMNQGLLNKGLQSAPGVSGFGGSSSALQLRGMHERSR